MEIKLKGSDFLFLRFGYDVLSLNQKEIFFDNVQHLKVVDIIKVVFVDRIETFQFNEEVQITFKKKILDFDQIYFYAKNHKFTSKGGGLLIWEIDGGFSGILVYVRNLK